jgi:formate hydrogenlyase transcriptional activator
MVASESPAASEAQRYEALFRVSQAISAQRDPKGLFCVLAHELRRVVRFDGIGVAQYDEVTKRIEWHLSERCSPQLPPVEIPPEQSMTCWVYQNQKALVIPRIDQEERFPAMIGQLKRYGIQSACALPLTTAHRRVGVVVLASEHPDAYSEEEVSFLKVVADMVALAIDDALNFEASRRAQERLKLILEVTNTAVSNLELRDVLRAVTASLRRVMRCDLVGVSLAEPDLKSLRRYVIDFPQSKGFIREETLVPIEGSLGGKVFQTRKLWAGDAQDVAALGLDKEPALAEGFRSGCVLPLVSRDRVLGVLALARLEESPFSEDEIELASQVAGQVTIAVENALAYGQIAILKDKLAQEKLYLEQEIRSEMNFDEIVGRSAALRHVLQEVETVAPTDSTVLIYGETGTGKELIARAIHDLSSRGKGAFVKLNCAAIPTGLLESEMFGHERGAFTGAVMQRIGRFELADRGTVFLDEIGEIPLELQPKLLRVLQEREFERLGSARTLRTDARLIAATNRDLGAMVEDQKFRADLFYRLNVFPVKVPSLRERTDDIPLLVRHFVQQFARRMNKAIDTIPSDTMSVLVRYHWPGNIRELQNMVERAVILSSGPVLRVPLTDLQAQPAASAVRKLETLEDAERRTILDALDAAGWVISGPKGAAAVLGLKRSTLQARMEKLGIRRARAAEHS